MDYQYLRAHSMDQSQENQGWYSCLGTEGTRASLTRSRAVKKREKEEWQRTGRRRLHPSR